MYAPASPRRRTGGAGGFTLMEIILVVVIIGILVTFVAQRITGGARTAKDTAAKHQIETFKNCLYRYQMDMDDFPQTLQGLVEKPSDVDEKAWKGPYLTSNVVPKDPWGHEYKYRTPGEHFIDFDIWSDGKDGQEDTEDDITSWVREDN